MGWREVVILLLPFLVVGIAAISLWFDKFQTDIDE